MDSNSTTLLHPGIVSVVYVRRPRALPAGRRSHWRVASTAKTYRVDPPSLNLLSERVGGRDSLDVVTAREAWVAAIEAAPSLSTPRDFLSWMDRFVKPILNYQMLACGIGHLMGNRVAADRLLVRGFPEDYLEALRQTTGVICLPRFAELQGDRLRMIDLSTVTSAQIDWESTAAAYHVGALASHDCGEHGYGPTTYFLFGHLARAPGPRQHYLIDILAPHMHAALVRALHQEEAPQRFPPPAALSRREREILNWLIAGRNTTEIAAHTHRSAHTINNQVRAILRKLRANNRTEAIAIAISMGLIQPIEPGGRTRLMVAQRRTRYIVSASEG